LLLVIELYRPTIGRATATVTTGPAIGVAFAL